MRDAIAPHPARTLLARRLGGVALALALGLGAVACSSSSDGGSSASGKDTSTTAADGSGGTSGDGGTGKTDGGGSAGKGGAMPADPCSVLSAADVKDLLGTEATGTAGASSNDGMIFDSCQWGELTDDAGQVSVAFSEPAPDTGIDYLQTLVGTAAQPTGAADVGDGGKVYGAFVRPGGGGVGKTVLFAVGDTTVAVGQSGAKVDEAKLIAAAKTVAGNL